MTRWPRSLTPAPRGRVGLLNVSTRSPLLQCRARIYWSCSTPSAPRLRIRVYTRYQRPVSRQLIAMHPARSRRSILGRREPNAAGPLDLMVGVVDLHDTLADQVENDHASA